MPHVARRCAQEGTGPAGYIAFLGGYIDDLRGMSDYTHELVKARECKENSVNMVIKG
jgi:hypothetical protein